MKIHEYAVQVRKMDGDSAALRSRIASVREQCTTLLRCLISTRRCDNDARSMPIVPDNSALACALV